MKQRLLTAAIGLPAMALFILSRFVFQGVLFDLFVVATILTALYEGLWKTGFVTFWPLLIPAGIYGAVSPFVYLGYIPLDQNALNVAFVILLFFLMLVNYKKVSPVQVAYTFLLSVAITFGFTTFALVSVDHNGLFFLLYAISCAWVSDAGGYFVGRAFGKHQLAPIISPHKTVEGAVGSVLSTLLVNAVFVFVYMALCPTFTGSPLGILLMTPLFTVVGIFGDLTASYLKRSAGIKDFGNLLPGHGGILDRFDSLLFVMPLVYLCLGVLSQS